jgi:arylsulfatase A-like enzyme
VNPGASGFDEWFSAPNFFDNDPILSREGTAIQTEGESSMVTVLAALEFIRRQEASGRPYLAVIWFGSPHQPHFAAEEDRVLYEDQPENLQHFYGEITGMDRAFGKLRDVIRSLPSHDHTILWYCSDNGGLPNVGSTGGRGHKGDIYEGGLRVPAILEWPSKIKTPRSTQFPSSTSDIFPTMLDIVGLGRADDRPLDGISLLPLIENKTDRRQNPMGFWQYPEGGIPTPSAVWMAELLQAQKNGDMIGDSTRLRWKDSQISKHYPADSLPGHAAWLDWPWKLHRIEDQTGIVRWELYQLENDPGEEEDLLETRAAKAAQMKSGLEKWQRSVVHSMNGLDY